MPTATTIRVGDKAVITSSNSIVNNYKELENITVKDVGGTPVMFRDLETMERKFVIQVKNNTTNWLDVRTGINMGENRKYSVTLILAIHWF